MLIAMALAACARTTPPAPVTNGSSGLLSTAPTPAEIVNSGPSSVVVQPGETLYALARTANVPVRSVIEANNLQPPYKLVTGQVLTIPRVRQHIVQPGETLYSVSRQFGVDSTALARMNNLTPPYTIKLGLPLVLPAPVGGVNATAVAAAPIPPGEAASAKEGVAQAPPASSGLSPADQVAADIAAEKAAAEKPASEKPGADKPAASLPVPTPPPPAASAAAIPPPAAPAAPVSPPPASPQAASQQAATQQAAGQSAVVPPPPATADTAQPTDGAPQQEAAARPPPVAADHRAPTAPLFFWPVRGRLVAGFGEAAGGAHNDGINIEAPAGTTVSAADAGIVAYAGNELRGFGNLILIKHADGWVSAYAHNKTLLVKKGDHVRRGQPIAQVGATGSVGSPQLHFELRRDRRAIDPLDHLPQLSGGEG